MILCFFEYSGKNFKLLFIAGPSYIFENMHCHCCKRQKRKKHYRKIKGLLTKIIILSKIKTSSQEMSYILGLLNRYVNFREKSSLRHKMQFYMLIHLVLSHYCLVLQGKGKLKKINGPFIPERSLFTLKYPYYLFRFSFLTKSCTEDVLCEILLRPVIGNIKFKNK